MDWVLRHFPIEFVVTTLAVMMTESIMTNLFLDAYYDVDDSSYSLGNITVKVLP